MKSTATPRFWALLNALPPEIQKLAEKNFHLWLKDPHHPSLQFKRLKGAGDRFSVRVGSHYRAIAWRPSPDTVQWLWIGSHADYDSLLS